MKSAALPSPSSSYRRCENEASRRLHRGAVETVQRLEQNLSQISNFNNFFSPEITELRTRLKDYCERLIFTDPVTYGKRAEELLWRKGYYEFFQKCRQNRKKLTESEFNRHTLRTHLLAAVGSYHHMLLRIQTEFHVDLNSKVDAPFLWHMRGLKKERWKKYQQSNTGDSAIHFWALQSSHRILTYLGDLARYLSELKHNNMLLDDSHLAERYYLQAFCLNPRSGFPHNQLASLANNNFDSAYHYMRCLSSPEKFDGAENNLMRVFDKNNQFLCEPATATNLPEEVQKHRLFFAKFLKLCEIFYFTSDENLQNICQDALQDFDACVISENFLAVEITNKKYYHEPVCLDDERVFRIVVMCMMCISKLHERGSSDVSTATAFSLALFSSVIHLSIKRLHLSVYENFEEKEIPVEADLVNNETLALDCDTKTTEEIKNKMNQVNQLVSGKKGSGRKAVSKLNTKRLRKMRRRRKMSSTSQEDSEISDVEVLELADGSDEENDILNSDVSQTGSCSSDTLSEHEDLIVEAKYVENDGKCASENFKVDVYINNVDNHPGKEEQKKGILNSTTRNSCKNMEQHLPNGCSSNLLLPDKIAEVLLQSTFMGTLKTIVDWLRTHNELLKLCAESLCFLLSRLTTLLNLFLKLEEELLKLGDLSELKRSVSEWSQVIPLPEDVLLQHLPSLENIQSNLDYDYSKRRYVSPIQVVFLRLQCILSFGDQFANCSGALIFFDKSKNEFILKALEFSKLQDKVADDSAPVENNMDNQRQQLMHEMAHLWLKSEVNHLEMSVKNSANPQLSPLLVVDTSSLCHHLSLLKQLIGAKYFVVIVPKVVIDNLDQLKKKSLGAREAIRWLEYIFQIGSRHVRTQRDGERSNLHPMKYPKRKDKESWDYFQILECCSFLTQQQHHLKSSCSLVTFLVGSNNHLPSNAAVLAKSLNINMENVENFFAKWRNSTKKPG